MERALEIDGYDLGTRQIPPEQAAFMPGKLNTKMNGCKS